jgi:O-antigen ligase
MHVAAALASLAVIGLIVAVATRTGRDVQVAGLAFALVVVLMSLRWPLLPLFAFAVLIPFEEAVVIGDLGTLSRYAALVFILSYGIPRLGRLTVGAMPMVGLGYVAWATLSAAWAIDSTASWTQITPLVLLFIVAVLVATVIVDRPTIIRPLLWAYTLSAAATAVLGIMTFLTSGGLTGLNDRIAGLTGQNPAYFAAILLPATVFALDELLHGRWLLLTAVVTMVCTIAIAISGTRAAWLSLAVILPVFVLPRLKPAQRVAAVGVVFVVLAITLQIPGISTLIDERTANALSSGGAGRTSIWIVGLSIFGSAPVTGVGLANFQIALTPELIRAAPLAAGTADTLANLGPHNIVVGTLGELGLIGFALLGAFLVPFVVRRGWGPDAALIQATLASLLVCALFLDMLARKELWLLIGMACGLAYLAKHETAPVVLPAGGRSPEPSPVTLPPARPG